MKALIACEESQRVCTEFRRLGHEAYSCDIQEPSGGHPEWHILGNVIPYINGRCEFMTMDGAHHKIDGRWDIIIAHPPCTYMSAAGACRMYPTKGIIDPERYNKAMQAREFFMQLYNADCDKVAVENPRPLKCVGLPPETQRIQPYEYGDPYSKLTLLWLKGLKHLHPTKVLNSFKPYVSCGTSRNKGNPDKSGYSRSSGAARARSKTFPGIAKAMAEQWGGECDNY